MNKEIFGISLAILLISGCIQNPMVVSADELWDNQVKYVGKSVITDGMIIAYDGKCTGENCMAEKPCCNKCSQSLKLQITENKDFFICKNNSGRIYCSGTNCETSCDPFNKNKNNTFKAFVTNVTVVNISDFDTANDCQLILEEMIDANQ